MEPSGSIFYFRSFFPHAIPGFFNGGFVKKLFLFSLLFCVACSQSDDARSGGPQRGSITEQEPYSAKASCEFANTDGQSGFLPTSAKIQSSYFGKKYDRGWLEAVLRTSGTETARLIQQTHTQLFQVPSAGAGCAFFGFLPSAPSDLAQFWRKAQDDSGNSLLGVYLATETSMVSVQQMPAILLRDKVDRYVLVHEFMHHNFTYHRRLENGPTEEELKNSLKTIGHKLDTLEEQYSYRPDEAGAHLFVQEYIRQIDLVDELMVRFTLEEMTIESILGREFESGRMSYAPDMAYQNGTYYIVSSAEQYTELMEMLDRELRSKESTFYRHANIFQQAKARLSEVVHRRRNDHGGILRQAQSRRHYRSQFLGGLSLSQNQNSQERQPCAHAAAAQEIYKVIAARAAQVVLPNPEQHGH